MSKRILLIEDDMAIARLLRDNLIYEGFVVEWLPNGEDLAVVRKSFAPNLILLDLMLPGVDGFDLCRDLTRSPARTPVIVITARGQKEDRVRGLTLGADDYVVKPFALEELLARIHAVLRRTTPPVERVTLGRVVIDFKQLRAFAGNQELALTDREFEIMRHLVERAGSIVSRDELLHLVWGYVDAPLTRTVDNFISRLRHKIEPDPHHPQYIRTAYGDGYRLALPD